MIVSSFVLVISAILTISHRSVGFKDQNTCMLYLIAGEKERERDKKKERERREREKRKIKRKEREIKRKSGKKR